MTTSSNRVYRGLSKREGSGALTGARHPIQVGAALLLALPLLAAISQGHIGTALLLVPVCGGGIGLVLIPVRGRPAATWLWHLLLHQFGVLTGWSRWQSRAAAGAAVDPGEPDLPGALQRLEFLDGPLYRDQGRVCLIHDTVEGRWGATARLTHSGVGMRTATDCEYLAARLGNMLLALGQRQLVNRVSLTVRTVPDDGTDYAAYRARREDPHAPRLARSVTDDLDERIGPLCVRYEIYVTVSGPEERLRRQANAAGGGAIGRGHVLYRALDGLEEPLLGIGAHTVRWFDVPALASTLRSGYNPAAAASLNRELRRTGQPALEKAAAGPTAAPAPSVRAYSHDGFTTVSYTALMPAAGTVFGSMAPLLAVHTPGERRSLTVHYEVLPAARSARRVQAGRYRAGVVADYKRHKGFNASATDEREASGSRSHEHAIAAGHAIVRYGVAAAVTVPRDWPIDDHAARLENDAAGHLRLLPLDLAQDAGFVAAVLPLGVGLSRERKGLL